MQSSKNLSHLFLFSKISRELSTITEISNSIDSLTTIDNKSKGQRYLQNHSNPKNILTLKRSKNYTSKYSEKLKKPLKLKRNSEKRLKKQLINLKNFRTNVNSPASRINFSRDDKREGFKLKSSKKHFQDSQILQNTDLLYKKMNKVEINSINNIKEIKSMKQKESKKSDNSSINHIENEIKDDLINTEVRNLTKILMTKKRIH